jgi:hypothetical protein
VSKSAESSCASRVEVSCVSGEEGVAGRIEEGVGGVVLPPALKLRANGETTGEVVGGVGLLLLLWMRAIGGGVEGVVVAGALLVLAVVGVGVGMVVAMEAALVVWLRTGGGGAVVVFLARIWVFFFGSLGDIVGEDEGVVAWSFAKTVPTRIHESGFVLSLVYGSSKKMKLTHVYSGGGPTYNRFNTPLVRI